MGESIDLEDIVWLAAASVVATYQMTTFARAVGNSRRKFKIIPPDVDGDPEFLRTFRAQQNCIEFFPIFLCIMWIAGVFFHQVPAAIAGLVYCYGRSRYFSGYVKKAEERVPGFMLCVKVLKALLAMSALGLGHRLLLMFAGINLKASITQTVGFGEL